MNRRTLVLLTSALLLAALAGQGFAREKTVESKWTGAPMMIDGLDAEWQGEALNTDDDGRMDYALRNDGAHLYLLFVIKDPKFLSSINATGLTVYLNPEGKKSKDHGLRFIRRPVPAEQLIASMERTGDLESIDMESSGPSGYSRSPKKYSFWVDVKLADPSR